MSVSTRLAGASGTVRTARVAMLTTLCCRRRTPRWTRCRGGEEVVGEARDGRCWNLMRALRSRRRSAGRAERCIQTTIFRVPYQRKIAPRRIALC